jgi:hypothetical protein
MPTVSRLSGRFFSVFLAITFVMMLPAAAIGEAGLTPPPPASPLSGIKLVTTADPPPATSGHVPAWPTARLFTLSRLDHGTPALLAQAITPGGQKSTPGTPAKMLQPVPKDQSPPPPTLCQITDTVYRADGSPAQGTALLSWPAFTTAAGQAVTPGSLTVTLDASGGFNASLAPNTGASPTGTYYRAIFKLDDGTTDSEYWVVPNAPTTTIGAIRSKLVPTNTAAQFLTRDFADSTYVALASTQTITGLKTFSNSPAVPTPQNPTDAANKAYVDANTGGNLSSPPPIGSATPNTVNATALTFQNIPGVEFLVSRFASIQAAINAAYNGGAVVGAVIDDRTAPYTGPGFILYDSVTLKLAATAYTITGTVTYNNGNNNVTAGIVALPGGRLIGASTSTNHGTIVTAGNGLNADLIATSTVGTGIGAAAQWWHWGGFQDLRVTGNGANQTAGNCFNIENMGETAFLRTIEVSGCYLDNILFTGASATPSDIANITTNSAGRYGFNFNNLSGVAVVHGLSGDSNTTSIVRLNGGQSGTLTIVGFKTEEEISGQDPLITIDQTGQTGNQPSLYIVGGYTFGRSGVNDVIKYVNGTAGTTPFISVHNFYVQNYVNAVNDVVNGRTTAAGNMNKVPFYYGPTGGFLSGQAFTLDLNTFVQSPHSGNGILTEVFGTTSSNETLVAASGTSTGLSIGGIGFRMPNRITYGQSPELFAKMTYAFPGGIPNTQQWEFIPAEVNGDTSTRWIGDPSYRWDELYAADVNTTTATVGTLNVTACNGCGTGTRLVSGTLQGATSTLIGNSTDQTIYTATLPAGTFGVGAGVHCYAKWTHPTASGAITYK